MTSSNPSQLTLSFEPSLADRFTSLRAFLAYRVSVQHKSAKVIAAEMDISPSLLTRKLNAGMRPEDTDTQRFNCDDLEDYLAATGDAPAVVEYLAAKYLHSDDHRKERVIARVEELSVELARALASLKGIA